MKKLCAALLRSFRRQHGKKMKGSAWGTWDPWKGQQQFRPNPNGVGDRTTTLRRLLTGAENKFYFHVSTKASSNTVCLDSGNTCIGAQALIAHRQTKLLEAQREGGQFVVAPEAGLSKSPRYPRHSPSFFCHAAS